MDGIVRASLLVILLCMTLSGQAQTARQDPLWRVWVDTTKAANEREAALDSIFSTTPTATHDEALARLRSNTGMDTLSRAYRIERARAMKYWGQAHLEDTAYARATEVLLQASAEFNSLGLLRDLHSTNRLLGRGLVYRGQLRQSSTLLMQALRAAEALQDTLLMVDALNWIAETYYFLGDLDQAERVQVRALHLVEGRYPDQEYAVLMRLANPMSEGAPVTPRYIAYLDRARSLGASGKVRSVDTFGEAVLKAFVQLDAGECDSALAVFEQPQEYMGWQIYLYWAKAEAHLCAHRYREAIEMASLGRSLSITHGFNTAVEKTLRVLAKGYEGLNDDAAALEAWKAYYNVRDSMRTASSITGLASAMLTADFEKEQYADSVAFASEMALQAKEVQRQRGMRNVFIGVSVLVALFAVVFLLQRNRINKERERSEELLLNILPKEVAEELKDTGAAQAKQFESATILFTDFKGFTQASENMSPTELVEELNACFKAFDHLITARGIEKIKTIGDAYMCVGGLPDPNASSPADVVHAALEMQAFIAQRKAALDAQSRPAFQMRVGIHTGPVVAGIVGVKKFSYDIWGDTVNTASRMESSGEVGQVNISEATYALVKDQPDLHFTVRGKVQAKGKGEMEMYFVSRGSDGA